VNSPSDCLSSLTHAAPHSTRTPCSSYTRLLACMSRRLTGARVFAAAAGQPSASSALRATPEPTNPSITFPRYLEALCATHCSAPHVPSPDFAQPRPCCPCVAAAARRRPLRPSCHRQSPRGEPNRLSRHLFATPCSTSPSASSPSPPGSGEGNRGHGCEGIKTSRGLGVKRLYTLFMCWRKLVKFI
jgi:hypothetical protein